ncbi:deoxyribose-phosphate aldolase [[Mycoplasma] testudinis]|uniref:deoxyribose-phosphate aldolase n=1 Tax=[Mycoplasma] testudinis TaxID=33924 RepID=UPI0005676831|nr:deoxyribose-phosphate aldolase [[Mycoplasma] testudinis]
MIEYNRMIDHTLLRADASPDEITKLCNEALSYNFFSVCVNPSYIALAKEKLYKSPVKICTVVGFPLGQTFTKQKDYEARSAIHAGADEIDMVINIPELKSKCACVVDEIRKLKKTCGKRILKVILETALLTEQEIEAGTLTVIEAGADFVKTSTGFSTRGASLEDVKIMKRIAGDKILIKAAGGIKTADDMIALVNAGANRIGTSRGVALMEELKLRKA